MPKLTGYLQERFLPKKKPRFIKDILVDADALIALAKNDDSNHKKAVKINQKLQKEGVDYYLSPFTVAEATTVLSYRVSQSAAKKFLKEIRKINLPTLELSKKYQNLPDSYFFHQNKKRTSYFDCYNMALLERYKTQIEAIFSFDSIYQKNGFQLAENR